MYGKTDSFVVNKLLRIFSMLLAIGLCHGQVVINEIMASNDTTIIDEQGEYDDWIELYNTDSVNIALGGMYLTDDLSNLTQWTIPEGTEIPPHGFLLVWADGNEGDGLLHTNFKLNADGEQVSLISANGSTIVDNIAFGAQFPDISYGRFPDGDQDLNYLTLPSPAAANYASGYSGISADPLFSNTAGFYESSILLELSTETMDETIYYTRDGSTPTLSDIQYSTPIDIFLEDDSISVIKARTYRDSYFPSRTVTNTYLLGEYNNLPVVSLSTDPENLFDDEIGIYVLGNEAEDNFPYWGANFWSDCPHSNTRLYNCEKWERPVHMEFFEPNGNRGFGIDVGARIHGHWMRGLPQKTLAIFARGQYGYSEINYPIFPNESINEFQAILLRSSGNDWSSSMMRDGLASTLGASRDLDVMAYRPSILFINGEYWGIHNIREKINEHYIRSHHPITFDNLDIIENSYGTWPNYGTMDNYDELSEFLNQNNMALDENYQIAADLIDIDELINYTVLEVYASNWDWIGGNCKRWYTPEGKWRWILNDLDAGFNQYPGQMHPPEENMFDNNSLSGFREFRNLKENEQFRYKFINAFADHLNTLFVPEYFISIVDSLRAIIEPEMPKHIERWRNTFIPGESWIGDGINSMGEWYYELDRLYDFATIRESHAWGFIQEEFELDGVSDLDFTGENTEGYIRLNTILLKDFPWEGKYFNGVPVELEAVPYDNYAFSHWVIDGETFNENLVNLTPSEAVSIQVFFEDSPGSSSPENTVVLNEINYSSEDGFDPGDWVELYNSSDSTFDMSDYYFMDEDDSHIFSFPLNTVLEPSEYLVLCRDTTQFTSIFPYVDNYIGNFDFGLSSGGEFVCIKEISAENRFIDSLTYDDESPWPIEPDGDGPTLALINPDLDNSIAESWEASYGHGTPGTINDVYTGIAESGDDDALPDQPLLYQNFPNPFNYYTRFNYSLPQVSQVSIKIFDMSGRYVTTLFEGQNHPGEHETEWHGLSYQNDPMGSGMYFCQLRVGSVCKTIKMIYLK